MDHQKWKKVLKDLGLNKCTVRFRYNKSKNGEIPQNVENVHFKLTKKKVWQSVLECYAGMDLALHSKKYR